MLQTLLIDAYWAGVEWETVSKHLPPDELRIETLDIDVFPSFQKVELQDYHLDLDESTSEIAVYRLGE